MGHLFIAVLFFSASYAQQTGMTPVQIAERNKPGTVMIQATFKGTVSVIQPVTDDAALTTLAQQIKQQLTDEGKFTRDLYWNTYIMAFCKSISQYMMKGTERKSKELNTVMIGSGFIITPDGYVVTNCHVVDENDEATRQGFVKQAFQQILKYDADGWEKTMGRKLSDEERKALTDANTWYYSQTMEAGNITKEFNVLFGITGDKGKIIPSVIPADLVIKGKAIPGKDVAILKLKTKHIYPTIRIGDDKTMRVGDQVYVLGYPVVATYHPLISKESVSEATLTRGIVSAKKNMNDGWEVLQIDAAITHGNSGGPVMNDKAEVIGLATFVSPDMELNQEIQGMNFLIPSTIVDEFLDKAKIQPKMSDISLVYEAAMDLFDKARYKKALGKFNEVKNMNASFPFIDKDIADAQSYISKGLDKEPKDMTMYYYIGGGVLLLILVLVLALRSKKKA